MFKLIISAFLIFTVLRCSGHDVNLPRELTTHQSTSEQTEQDEQAFQSVTEKEERRLQAGAGSTPCIEVDVKYTGASTGNGLGTVSASNVLECYKLCILASGCRYWSHDRNRKLCTRLSSVNGKTATENFTSGNVNCYFPSTPCLLRNFVFTEAVLMTFAGVSDESRCHALSFMTPESMAWSWNRNTSACLLYKADRRLVTSLNHTSGSLICSHLPVSRSECTEIGVSYGGDRFSEASPYDCYLRCLRTISCKLWSHNEVDGSCYTASSESGKRIALKYTAGRLDCVAGKLSFCVEDNFAYDHDHVFARSTALSFHACYQQCLARTDCQFFTYGKDDLQCELNNSIEGGISRIADENSVSGTICSTSRICTEHAFQYQGRLIQRLTVSNMFQCQVKCEDLPLCKLWSYDRHSGTCKTMKTKITGIPMSPIVSGTRDCLRPSPRVAEI